MGKSNIKDYLFGAEESKKNAIQLRNNANTLSHHEVMKPLAIFTMYTAIEEIQKGIFCLFAHKKLMPKSIISNIFSDHEAKSFLFYEIFKGNIRVENHQVMVSGKKFTSDTLKALKKKHKRRHQIRMAERNNGIYVGRKDKWLLPSDLKSRFTLRKNRLMIELTALFNFYGIVKSLEGTTVDNFTIRIKHNLSGDFQFTLGYDEI